MCTAATYKTKDFYFGRTLDYEFSYGEQIVILPRKFPIPFRFMSTSEKHYAMIGMAHVADGYPMFYDAINEKGLAMAGLNFVGNAVYQEPISEESSEKQNRQSEVEKSISDRNLNSGEKQSRKNVAQFEFISWILSKCSTVQEVRMELAELNLTGTPYNEHFPPAQLHWMIADENETITVEAVADGLKIYDNTAGVLTNNPPFKLQMFHLNNYMNLSPKQPENNFAPQMPLSTYSRGMGALGLPGDLSSMSRFVRAAFTRAHSVSDSSENASVSQFFHILGSVEQQRGCCEVAESKYEITIYTSCCNTSKGIYYYTTYDNSRITAVDMHKENLDGEKIVCYPMLTETDILRQNG